MGKHNQLAKEPVSDLPKPTINYVFGRPTKYTSETIPKALDYIANHREYGSIIPSHPGMALALGITTTTLYAWANDKDKKDFSEIVEMCKQVQHECLMNGGMSGDFNSGVVRTVLSKHGYSDNTDGSKGISFNINVDRGQNGSIIDSSSVSLEDGQKVLEQDDFE